MLQIDSDTSFPDIDSEKGQTEDLFCTLLYNDETHTFDQVSITLFKCIYIQFSIYFFYYNVLKGY